MVGSRMGQRRQRSRKRTGLATLVPLVLRQVRLAVPAPSECRPPDRPALQPAGQREEIPPPIRPTGSPRWSAGSAGHPPLGRF